MKYNMETSKQIRNMKADATISEGYLTIEIFDVRYEYNDEYVVWGWSDETVCRRSKLRGDKFRVGNTWYSLSDAIRTIF